jgi:hypothetical protein
MAMSFDRYYFAQPLLEMIHTGKIEPDCLDEKIEHILSVYEKIGIFDPNRPKGSFNTPNHRKNLPGDSPGSGGAVEKREEYSSSLQKQNSTSSGDRRQCSTKACVWRRKLESENSV